MKIAQLTYQQRMNSAWGESAPEWIVALAAECDRTSAGQCALRLKIAKGFIRFALDKMMTDRAMENLARRVQTTIMGQTVNKPKLQAFPMPATQAVKLYWSEDVPDWVLALADHCEKFSQKSAADRLGKSVATISLTLRNRYPASTTALEASLRATIMRKFVVCPILGEISGDDCAAYQVAPYDGSNHVTVSLFRACRTCPNNTLGRRRPCPASS